MYKRGFGWIPFDMTNSVSDDSYTGQPFPEETQKDKEPESSENDSEDDDFIQEDINETEDVQKEDKADSDKDIDKIDQNNDSNSYNFKLLVAAGTFTLFLLLGVVLVIYNRIKFVLLFRKLSLADTSSERVIIYFGILNKFLKFCGFRNIFEMDDKEYTEKLYSRFAGKISETSINSACEILQCAAFSNSDIEYDLEDEVALFVKNVSHEAYKECKKPLRFIIYVCTGRNQVTYIIHQRG